MNLTPLAQLDRAAFPYQHGSTTATGLTKLEYFTAKALAGLCANPNVTMGVCAHTVVSETAVEQALRTIKALESHVQKTKQEA